MLFLFSLLLAPVYAKQKTQPTNKQTNPKTKLKQTQNLKQKVRKIVYLFSDLAQSCATLNLVLFSSDTVDSVSNQDGCHYGTHEIYC